MLQVTVEYDSHIGYDRIFLDEVASMVFLYVCLFACLFACLM